MKKNQFVSNETESPETNTANPEPQTANWFFSLFGMAASMPTPTPEPQKQVSEKFETRHTNITNISEINEVK